MRNHCLIIEPLEARIAPATFTVTNLADSGANSLRAELAAADAHGGTNTIVFKLPAPPLHGENIITLTSGALTSKGDVTIKGPGAGKLIISGGGSSSIFDIGNTADPGKNSPTTISGLSIVDGKGTDGGGIYCEASLTLKHVVISGNTADSGGGVDVIGSGKASITDSLITDNSATNSGGGLGIFEIGAISISNTIVTGNTATNGGGGIYASVVTDGVAITGSLVSGNTGGFGGGLIVRDFNTAPASKITITGAKITGNTSKGTGSGGGGLYVGLGNAAITGSTIGGNTAVYDGGGIEAKGFASLTVSSTTITGNQTTNTNAVGQGGGGVFMEGSGSATPAPAKITGSLITSNSCAYAGGGLYALDGIGLTISGSTFSGNHAATFGGGVETFGTGVDKVNLTVTGGVFSNNGVIIGPHTDGGAILTDGDGAVSITGAKVTGNSAGFSGGILISGAASLTIKNAKVTDNFSSNLGGGLTINNISGFHVMGGSFTGNAASHGGGIYLEDSTGSILGVTISGNAATSAGGGVAETGSTVTLGIAKVIANTAPVGPDVSGTFTFV